MKWWILFFVVGLISCVDEAEEKSITSTTATNKFPDSSRHSGDTSENFAKDTSGNVSFTIPEIKKPSGIYQFLLPYDAQKKVLHTISFNRNQFRLEEEYGLKDSVVVTEGTWAPSRGFIWLYKDQVVRGRYTWKGDTLQYFSPRLNKTFSMTKLTPASVNPVFQKMKKEGAVLYGVGTEPFWAVEVKSRDSIILSMPEWTEPLRVKLSGTTRENGSIVYSAATDSLRVTIQRYFCSDGMSDFVYTHKLTMHYKGQIFNGCGIVF